MRTIETRKPALVASIVCILTAPVGAGQRQATRQQPARSAPGSRVHKVEELAWPIDAFNRQRTLFILPVGMIEQHGPHLPVGADTIGVTYEANGASTRVSRALPDWNVVMMPPINYGHSGANQLGDMPVHPGTYAIRQSTLRSLVADLGATDRAERLQMDFRHERPRRTHAQHRHQRGMRLRQRNVSRDDAAPHRLCFGPMRRFNRAERRSTPSTFPPQSSPPSAWMFMPASAKHRACSLSGPIWFVPITKRCPAERGVLWRSCAKSRPRPVGRAISRLLRGRRRRTAGRSRHGGSTGSRT